MEDTDKHDNNNKDDNNDKSVSALGLDRDMRFSRGYRTFLESQAQAHLYDNEINLNVAKQKSW